MQLNALRMKLCHATLRKSVNEPLRSSCQAATSEKYQSCDTQLVCIVLLQNY